jgi:hypothetical protein
MQFQPVQERTRPMPGHGRVGGRRTRVPGYSCLMNRLAKLFPMAIGLFLGILALHPPEWLRALGPFRYAGMAVLVCLLLTGFVALLIASNLPADVKMVPAHAPLPPEMTTLAGEYQALGFVPACPPQEVGIAPPALVQPFVNESARVYGTVFRTGTLPARIAFDFFSLLADGRGGLSSCAERGGAVLPAGPGSLSQILPGASVAQLFAAHRQALEFLRPRGLPARPVSAATFEVDFRAGLARQRRNFLAAPLRNAAIAIWRTASRTTPHLGAIETQRVARRQMSFLLTGAKG